MEAGAPEGRAGLPGSDTFHLQILLLDNIKCGRMFGFGKPMELFPGRIIKTGDVK